MSTADPTRWELLFADLEARLAAEEALEREGVVAELTRAEQATVPFGDRLRSAVGRSVRVDLVGDEVLDGRLLQVADSWLLMEGQGARGRVQHLVPVAAVAGVVGLGRHAVPSVARTDRLGLGHVLRGLQRDRARVRVVTGGGGVLGRIARVGADHLDVEEVDRPGLAVRTVPFAAVRRVSEA